MWMNPSKLIMVMERRYALQNEKLNNFWFGDFGRRMVILPA